MDFILIFIDFNSFKKGKKGVYISTRPAELTWHVRPARMQHGTQGHVAAPRGPTRGDGANTWQDHASPRGRPGGSVRGLEGDGPMS